MCAARQQATACRPRLRPAAPAAAGGAACSIQQRLGRLAGTPAAAQVRPAAACRLARVPPVSRRQRTTPSLGENKTHKLPWVSSCCRSPIDVDSAALPENFCIIESPESVKVRRQAGWLAPCRLLYA